MKGRLKYIPIPLSLYTVLFFCLSLPAFGQTVITLDRAIQAALSENREIRIAGAQRDRANGARQAAAGQFDWRLTGMAERSSFPALSSLGYALNAREQVRERYYLGIEKPFRNSLILGTSVEVIRSEIARPFTVPVEMADIRLTATLPLWRGFGPGNTAAEERAARIDLQGAETLRIHRIAVQIAHTAIAFYDALAAEETLRMVQNAEVQAQETRALMEQMVRSRLLYADDLFEIQGVIEALRMKRLRAEQEVYRAHLKLAEAMAAPLDQVVTDMRLEGVFPTPSDSSHSADGVYARYAAVQRGDYLAVLTAMESSRIRLRAARNLRKPRIDLNAAIGYSGYDPGAPVLRRFDTLFRLESGPNFVIGVGMGLSVMNHEASGRAAVEQAERETTEYRSEALLQKIYAEIHEAAQMTHAAAETYHAARSAEWYFEEAARSQEEKTALEIAPPSSLIQIQSRLLETRLEGLRALRDHAVALVKLRLATGTLLDLDEPVTNFDLKRLTTMPTQDE